MTRITPVGFILLGTLAGTAEAQSDATAPVSASIAADLRMTATGETSFGTVANFAHTETINPAAPTATQQVARFETNATNGTVVVFSCPSSVTLSAGTATLTFTPQPSAATFADGQSVSSPVSCSTGLVSDVFPLYVWLGGSIVVAGNQPPGDYSGVFTLTAQYQ